MNYVFRLAHDMKGGKSPTFVVHLKIDEWQRPAIHHEIKLPISNKTWRIVRSEPANNPPGQLVTYFIEEV